MIPNPGGMSLRDIYIPARAQLAEVGFVDRDGDWRTFLQEEEEWRRMVCIRELTDSLRAPRWPRVRRGLVVQAQAVPRRRRPHAKGQGCR